MDLNQIPKQYCENVVAGHTPEHFIMVMTVGNSATAYALSPKHMKRLVQSLTHQLAEYEKQFGTIDATWAPGIESPIQTKDLGQ